MRMRQPKNYRVTITDRDGESHIYTMVGWCPYNIAIEILHAMNVNGDFYGQKEDDTIELNIAETWVE